MKITFIFINFSEKLTQGRFKESGRCRLPLKVLFQVTYGFITYVKFNTNVFEENRNAFPKFFFFHVSAIFSYSTSADFFKFEVTIHLTIVSIPYCNFFPETFILRQL